MIRWTLDLTTAPATEPVSRAEAKLHLRLDTDLTDEDDYIDDLITMARSERENALGIALIEQTRKLKLQYWPSSGRIYLPYPPLKSVTSITYVDQNGDTQTLNSSVYQVVRAQSTVATDPPLVGYIQPAYGQSWPNIRGTPEGVTVTYVCGWANAAAVPQPLRQAVLLQIGEMYANREAGGAGATVAPTMAVEALSAAYRCYHDFGEDCG